MTRLCPGDIIEVEMPNGLAYLHLTHEAAPYPPVVRVLARGLAARPADFGKLARGPAAFTGLVPLSEILSRGAITGRKVATLATGAQPFPLFRTPIRDRQGAVVYWWLWDGTGLRWCGTDEEQIETYPLREIIGAEELLARLSAG
jgi:hypothetical protein